MRIAFYAPLKPPTHPNPSGDRRMARLLMKALARAGHEVELAATLRSRNDSGDPARQAAIARQGREIAEGLIRAYRARPVSERPEAWFTYHLYYKAPDWLGPRVADALDIPYVVAEASHAPKRATGPWAMGHAAAAAAIRRADAILLLNPSDAPGLSPALVEPERLVPLRPFIEPAGFAAARARRDVVRAAFADALRLDREQPWLLTVARMRPGDKLASYRLLADALRRIPEEPWHLLIIGDGPAQAAVQADFQGFSKDRVRFLGPRRPEDLPDLYAAADLYLWPAVNEAYGMALLEAQAAGLPVVAGAFGGVPAVVGDGVTGLLTRRGDAQAFATAVRGLLADPERRRAMGAAAAARIAAEHDLDAAAGILDGAVRQACARHCDAGAVRRRTAS